MTSTSTAPQGNVVNGNHDNFTGKNDEVLFGPDLNKSKAPLDKKLYRQIILKRNGLRVLLISDVLALGQKFSFDDDDSNNEKKEDSDIPEEDDSEDLKESLNGDEILDEEEDEGYDEQDDYEEDDSEDGEEGFRKAAASLVVGAGSFHDPPHVMGMAHFLEHMVFMGTKKYPTENAYDSFLTDNGGSDNAYTELEHTVFHFDIPQEKLFQALDMFAQFFVEPLLLPDAVDRELNAIDSEFQLVKNSDECRLEQLLFHTSGKDIKDHPFGTFSWGNLESLKTIPEKNNVDVLAELRKFHNQYYNATNMSLVVIGAYSLDELQDEVIKCFSDIPSQPRIESPLAITIHNSDPNLQRAWDDVTIRSPIKNFGMPFDPSSLAKIYRMQPVKDRHSLSVTWQLPPQQENWKSKPTDYLAHLLGHEGEGSLLSALKKKSWVTSCFAGMGTQGYEYASSHTLFTVTFTLSIEGIKYWSDIIQLTYLYIGMIRYYCNSSEGLPNYIYDELKAINEVSYKFADEQNPADFVEELVDDMAPDRCLPPERLLDGYMLLFSNNEELIKDIVDEYLIPSNGRVDMMSSTFGRASETVESEEKENLDDLVQNSTRCHAGDAVSFSPKEFGKPFTEPRFGSKYWCHSIPSEVLERWADAASPSLQAVEAGLKLPAINPYVPTEFGLKKLDDEDAAATKIDESPLQVVYEGDFPIIPPPLPETRLPRLITDDQTLKLWWLQDRTFKRPTAELRMKIISENVNKNPFYRGCSDLLVLLWKDATSEVTYQAYTAQLGTSISVSDGGYALRVNGFDHKLQSLSMELLNVLFSFAGRTGSDGLPISIKEGRFEACLEILRRRYSNVGMQSSSMSTNVRLECLRSTSWSANAKLQALESIDVATFTTCISSILENLCVEALYHGNCDSSDAEGASQLISNAMSSHGICGLPKEKYPTQFVTKLPLSESNDVIVVPSKDKNDKNIAVEVYFQVGPDNLSERVLIDLLVQIIDEPLYAQLRSKDQFGYYVSSGVKWTHGVMGISFKVVSSSKSAVEVQERINKFIIDFQEQIISMSDDKFKENVIGLAKNKLEMYNSLEEECADLWSEIVDFHYEWESSRAEAVYLRTVTKEQVLEAYNKWLYPMCGEGKKQNRRCLAVVVQSDDPERDMNEDVSGIIDSRVTKFHEKVEKETWGLMNFEI